LDLSGGRISGCILIHSIKRDLLGLAVKNVKIELSDDPAAEITTIEP
jgi:hypothetical protein